MVPFVQSIIDKMCDRLGTATETGEPIDLKYCYAALSFDIISEYCFSMTPDRILKPDFDKKPFDDIDDFVEMSLVVSHAFTSYFSPLTYLTIQNLYIPYIINAVASLPVCLLELRLSEHSDNNIDRTAYRG